GAAREEGQVELFPSKLQQTRRSNEQLEWRGRGKEAGYEKSPRFIALDVAADAPDVPECGLLLQQRFFRFQEGKIQNISASDGTERCRKHVAGYTGRIAQGHCNHP